MSKKIYISPSNQVYNTYATGGTNEKEQCHKIAKACVEYLEKKGLLTDKVKGGKNEFYVSDSVANFSQLGSTFLGSDIGAEVRKTEAFTE